MAYDALAGASNGFVRRTQKFRLRVGPLFMLESHLIRGCSVKAPITMTKSRKNPKVDVYLSKAKKWRAEIEKLRSIILDCQLTEELKWAKPCYTFQESNIVVILPLRAYILYFSAAKQSKTREARVEKWMQQILDGKGLNDR